MTKRTRGFDKLWRWSVTDELDMPDGKKMAVTARRLTRIPKQERDAYAYARARELNRKLADKESTEYKEFLLPLQTLSKDDILRILEHRERLQLTAQSRLEILSPSPSDKENDATTLKERLDAMDLEDENQADLEQERLDWVEASLTDNMADLREREHSELLRFASESTVDNLCNAEWWVAYNDANLKLGIFAGDKPFFKDWPTEADDDLKAKLLELYQDADATSFDFSF